MRSLALMLTLTLFGCIESLPRTASVLGRVVYRPDLHFTGDPYEIRHRGAHPNSHPSGGVRDHGGVISGLVCGVDVEYEVQHRADGLHMFGRRGSQLRVYDEYATRIIEGRLGTGTGVEIYLSPGRMIGHVGRFAFDYEVKGDDYVGLLAARWNEQRIFRMSMRGVHALWEMPAADQAAVLPILLGCPTGEPGWTWWQRDPTPVAFGGPAHLLPPRGPAFIGTVPVRLVASWQRRGRY